MSSNKKIIISNEKYSLKNKLLEIKEYRELLLVLAWKDLRVKYSQTYIGFLWAILNPLFTLFVLYFIFGIVVKVDTQNTPQMLFTMVGLSAWSYFAILMNESGSSLLSNQNMIQKIFFPRILLPLSKAISGLVDLGISLILVVIIMLIYGYIPPNTAIFLPFIIMLLILTGLTGGIWVSALSIRYRDFRFINEFIIRLGLYASPVAFSSSSVPENFKFLYNLNPMVGIIDCFRWCVLGTPFHVESIFLSILLVLIIFITGLLYFQHIEKFIADII